MQQNELGDFLRRSRERLQPSDVGLPTVLGSRRVRGLRREEVAVLAGVSTDYYARLEQGRERNPSPQVLDAIGNALRLTRDGREHSFRLADINQRLMANASEQDVHPHLLELLDQFPYSAAYVLGPAFDVLASNHVAAALLSPFGTERSMPRILFTDPVAKTVFADWELLRRATVEALRLNVGRFPDDRHLAAVIQELRSETPTFEDLWEEHTVGSLTRAFKVFVHPEVGRIELTYQSFDVREAPGQQLLVGTPATGTRSAEALAFLASTTAHK